MNTTIDANGTLTVTAETQFEAYALRRWSEENFDFSDVNRRFPNLLIVFPPDLVGNAFGLSEFAGLRTGPSA